VVILTSSLARYLHAACISPATGKLNPLHQVSQITFDSINKFFVAQTFGNHFGFSETSFGLTAVIPINNGWAVEPKNEGSPNILAFISDNRIRGYSLPAGWPAGLTLVKESSVPQSNVCGIWHANSDLLITGEYLGEVNKLDYQNLGVTLQTLLVALSLRVMLIQPRLDPSQKLIYLNQNNGLYNLDFASFTVTSTLTLPSNIGTFEQNQQKNSEVFLVTQSNLLQLWVFEGVTKQLSAAMTLSSPDPISNIKSLAATNHLILTAGNAIHTCLLPTLQLRESVILTVGTTFYLNTISRGLLDQSSGRYQFALGGNSGLGLFIQMFSLNAYDCCPASTYYHSVNNSCISVHQIPDYFGADQAPVRDSTGLLPQPDRLFEHQRRASGLRTRQKLRYTAGLQRHRVSSLQARHRNLHKVRCRQGVRSSRKHLRETRREKPAAYQVHTARLG